MTDRAQRPAKPSRARTTRSGALLLLLAAIIAAAGLAVWSQLGPRAERDDPHVVVNLTTMVGEEAPAFTLPDSEGRRYAVTPGEGRNYVLVFHMGSR